MKKNYKSQIELTPELEKYITKLNGNSNVNFEKLRNLHSNIDDKILQITSNQAYFLSFIQKILNTKLALDIGTYKGYSALIAALSTDKNSRIISCEIDEELGNIAKDYWESNGVLDKIDLIIGNAVSTLTDLLDKGYKNKFDFIFIDADKVNYVNYYELSLQLVRPKGIIAIDNTLFFGTVIGNKIEDEYLKKFVSKESTDTIKKLNKIISNDNRVEKCLLPISDGLTLVMKK